MIIDNANMSFVDTTTLNIPADTIFINCPHVQEKGNTKIYPGRTDLTFIGCNLKGCVLDVPPKNIIDCLYGPNVQGLDTDLTEIV